MSVSTSDQDQRIRVMIADDILDTREQLEKLLLFERDIEVIGSAADGREVLELVRSTQPHVVLMDVNMPVVDGITATQAIRRESPGTQVIIVSIQSNPEYFRRAMNAGARDYLVKPFAPDDLYEAIRSIAPAQLPPQPQVVSPRATANGKVIAVLSPKGGAGTSVVAANMGIALRQLTNKKVAIFDGDLELGHQHIMLNLLSTRTISDLVERIDQMDEDLLNHVMMTHPSQVKVLLAPLQPQDSEHIRAEHITRILEMMKQQFDYIIVDVPSFTQDKSIAMLDIADRIVLLMTLEMTCITDIRRFLDVADLLDYPPEKLLLVLNKADNRRGLRAEQVESHLKRKVELQIGNAEDDMTYAINQGVPLVICKRDHRVSKDLFALAQEVSRATAATAQPKRGLFERILGAS